MSLRAMVDFARAETDAGPLCETRAEVAAPRRTSGPALQKQVADECRLVRGYRCRETCAAERFRPDHRACERLQSSKPGRCALTREKKRNEVCAPPLRCRFGLQMSPGRPRYVVPALVDGQARRQKARLHPI